MMSFVWNVGILSIVIFIVAKFLPGIRLKNYLTAIIVALVYSVINFVFGWLLMLLTFPFMFITFGLFKFVINAFMLWITDKLIEDFEIESLRTTFIAAFLITVIDSIIKWIL
ncbi:phage holin family protein [candidate division KSB1 bacterium]